jgi:hypothetical protein
MPAFPAPVVAQPERPYWLDWVPVLVPTADYRLCGKRGHAVRAVSADWDAPAWAAMSPTLVAGDVAPAEAVVLGRPSRWAGNRQGRRRFPSSGGEGRLLPTRPQRLRSR